MFEEKQSVERKAYAEVTKTFSLGKKKILITSVIKNRDIEIES